MAARSKSDGPAVPADEREAEFASVLFPADGEPAAGEPAFFGDLNLNQVVTAITAGKDVYDLAPFFHTPLHSVAAVRYRHEVFRDLQNPAVLAVVQDFAAGMREMRAQLERARKAHYTYQKQRWFLDATGAYLDTVNTFRAGLHRLSVCSFGLRGLNDYLARYVQSVELTDLERETAAMKAALGEVRYSVHIKGTRVRVMPVEEGEDYSAEVERTFARFKEGTVKNRHIELSPSLEMNHVEARILALVAKLYPDVFRRLGQYYERHQDYLDVVIGTFDREIQFYVAYLGFLDRYTAAGLPFCYPEEAMQSSDVAAEDAFDLALVGKLTAEGKPVVRNKFALRGTERILVVTGPNQGGKTTFARMFGQVHYLGSLGCLVPAREARLFLPDQIFTHFEREEDITTLHGKLEDELTRIHDILRRATEHSLLIMNESFTSTTLQDALFLGEEVMQRIIAIGLIAVYVTFVDELASLGPSIVSMVSTVEPDNPAQRTFKIERRPADGLAYAAAIARKYGLTYQAVRERVRL